MKVPQVSASACLGQMEHIPHTTIAWGKKKKQLHAHTAKTQPSLATRTSQRSTCLWARIKGQTGLVHSVTPLWLSIPHTTARAACRGRLDLSKPKEDGSMWIKLPRYLSRSTCQERELTASVTGFDRKATKPLYCSSDFLALFRLHGSKPQ